MFTVYKCTYSAYRVNIYPVREEVCLSLKIFENNEGDSHIGNRPHFFSCGLVIPNGRIHVSVPFVGIAVVNIVELVLIFGTVCPSLFRHSISSFNSL